MFWHHVLPSRRTTAKLSWQVLFRRALGQDDEILPRNNFDLVPGALAVAPSSFETVSARDRVSQVTNCSVRDRSFQKFQLHAYCERRAIADLRLVNESGYAEIEAAHVRPLRLQYQ